MEREIERETERERRKCLDTVPQSDEDSMEDKPSLRAVRRDVSADTAARALPFSTIPLTRQQQHKNTQVN